MRKRIKNKKLSRSTKQRKALFRSLITSLIEHGEIKTTKAKAKAVKGLVEKLITKGKQGTLHSRRMIQRVVLSRKTANKIVDEISKQYKNMKGGYLKMVSLGNRRGDNAPIVKLSLKQLETDNENSKPTTRTTQPKQTNKTEKAKSNKNKSENTSKKPSNKPNTKKPQSNSDTGGSTNSRTTKQSKQDRQDQDRQGKDESKKTKTKVKADTNTDKSNKKTA